MILFLPPPPRKIKQREDHTTYSCYTLKYLLDKHFIFLVCFLDTLYSATACFKWSFILLRWLFKSKAIYPLVELMNVASWAMCRITKQVVRVYLIFRQLYTCCLQRITCVSLEKKVPVILPHFKFHIEVFALIV